MPRRPVSTKDFADLSELRADLYCRVSSPGATGEREVDEKSIDDQEREGQAWAARTGVKLGEVFRDGGSASQFATKERPGFRQLLDHVKAGKVDVVWVWAVDRSQRDLEVFAQLRSVFVQHQVALSVNGRLHDPNDYDAWMLLGITSFFGERYSVELSKNVRRGLASNANRGLPHGRVTYGYRRRRSETRPELIADDHVWVDKRTGQFVWQEPDTWDGNGQPVERSPAWIVREMYRRLAAGESLSSIARDLSDRRIPLPKGKAVTPRSYWHEVTVRRIALNPAYIGRRVHQGEVLPDIDARWPALVDEETFWTVHQVLTEPTREQSRPARAKALLSFLVTCGKCGGPVGTRPHRGYRSYSCKNRSCTSIAMALLDDYVEEVMIRWLSRPDVFAELTRVDDSAVAAQARADAAQARAQLAEWRQAAEKGDVTLAGYSSAEKGLLARIEEADKRAQDATMPAVLVGNVGDQAEERWRSRSIEVKRQMIQAVADITLKPGTQFRIGRGDFFDGPPVIERVDWQWLIGPEAGQIIAAPAAPRLRMLASDAQVLAAIHEDGTLRQSELKRRHGSVFHVVTRLERRGWITRQRATREGTPGARPSTLALTDSGRQALADAGITADGR